MLRSHRRGRHHIVSCGHERTCLLRIVQRILNPRALRLQPEIYCSSVQFIQITVTGRSCQCHHLAELRSCLIQPPRNQCSRLGVGVLSRDTFKFEKAKEASSMRAKTRIRLCHPADRREGRVMLMAEQRGLHAATILTENGGCLTVSQIPSASPPFWAPLQLQFKLD